MARRAGSRAGRRARSMSRDLARALGRGRSARNCSSGSSTIRATRLARIERGEGVLVDELDLAAELPQRLALAARASRSPSIRMRAGGGRQEADDAAHRRGLARARLRRRCAWVVPRAHLEARRRPPRGRLAAAGDGEVLHQALDDDGDRPHRPPARGAAARLGERRRIRQQLARIGAARRRQHVGRPALLLDARRPAARRCGRRGRRRRRDRASPAAPRCRTRGAARRSGRGCGAAP